MLKSAVDVLADSKAIAEAASALFLELVVEAVEDRGRCDVALSGGTTPRVLFERLAAECKAATGDLREALDATHFFWADERFVPHDHPESNFGMARDTLFASSAFDDSQLHPVPTWVHDASEAALAYEQEMELHFELEVDPEEEFGATDTLPVFDLILLGMGRDGHTASLFPDTKALEETDRDVVANWVPHLECYRITMTLPLINRSRNIAFLVSGAEKATAVAQVLGEGGGGARLPAARVQPAVPSRWLVDEAAASQLQRG